MYVWDGGARAATATTTWRVAEQRIERRRWRLKNRRKFSNVAKIKTSDEYEIRENVYLRFRRSAASYAEIKALNPPFPLAIRSLWPTTNYLPTYLIDHKLQEIRGKLRTYSSFVYGRDGRVGKQWNAISSLHPTYQGPGEEKGTERGLWNSIEQRGGILRRVIHTVMAPS